MYFFVERFLFIYLDPILSGRRECIIIYEPNSAQDTDILILIDWIWGYFEYYKFNLNGIVVILEVTSNICGEFIMFSMFIYREAEQGAMERKNIIPHCFHSQPSLINQSVMANFLQTGRMPWWLQF